MNCFSLKYFSERSLAKCAESKGTEINLRKNKIDSLLKDLLVQLTKQTKLFAAAPVLSNFFTLSLGELP